MINVISSEVQYRGIPQINICEQFTNLEAMHTVQLNESTGLIDNDMLVDIFVKVSNAGI